MTAMTHQSSRRSSSHLLLRLLVVLAVSLTPASGVPAPGHYGGPPRAKSLDGIHIVPYAPVGEPCDKLCTFKDSSPAKHYCCDMETGPGANPGSCPEKVSVMSDGQSLPPSPCTYDADCTSNQKCCWDTYLQRKYCFETAT